MRAITLHQPWAWAIVQGYKQFETRSWRTNYRGPLAIHAGKTVDWDMVAWSDLDSGDIVTGAIVAVADLIDCDLTDTLDPNTTEDYWGDWRPGRFGWDLGNVTVLDEPVPCRGYQGLWTPSEDVVAQIAKAT